MDNRYKVDNRDNKDKLDNMGNMGKGYNIKSFKDYKRIERDKLNVDGTFIGIGVTAFMRFFPSVFLKDYVIYAYKDSTDNPLIEEHARVFSLKKKWPKLKLRFTNTNNLLLSKTIRNDIKKIVGEKYLFVYKMNNNIAQAIDGLGISNIIAVSPKLNKMFENKASFRKILEKIKIPPIKGLSITFKQFQKLSFEKISDKVGFPFVIQMPDFLLGGGKGTVFIHSKEDFIEFQQKTETGRYKSKDLTRIIITKFIVGDSCSVVCSTTKYGTFVSPINYQIMDIPEVIQTHKGSGLFVGHVFGRNYGSSLQKQAHDLGVKIGNYMYKQGFKGIFGIDIMVDQKNKKVYPVEVNARYTGAFPMISMLQRDNNIIPLDFFHFLENLNIPYKVDYKKIETLYKKNIGGSHIVFSNHQPRKIFAIRKTQAGLYEWKPTQNKAVFIKPTLLYTEIKNDNQFIICDGTPKKGDEVKRYSSVARVSHLLFSADIIDANGQLKNKYKDLVHYLYKHIFGSRYKTS